MLEQQGKIHPESLERINEKELLGLDKPIYEILTDTPGKEESGLFSKAVHLLYSLSEDDRNIATLILLRRFGLNVDIYDEKSNPQGAYLRSEANKYGARAYAQEKALVLRLLGVANDVRASFFGHQNVSMSALSPAGQEAIKNADQKRNTYAFQHLDKFPKVKAAYERVQSYSNLSWEEIFEEGHIPMPESLAYMAKIGGGKAHSLEDVLLILGDALSGEKTQKEILTLRKTFTKQGLNVLLHQLDSRKTTHSLKPAMLKLIEEKIKK